LAAGVRGPASAAAPGDMQPSASAAAIDLGAAGNIGDGCGVAALVAVMAGKCSGDGSGEAQAGSHAAAAAASAVLPVQGEVSDPWSGR